MTGADELGSVPDCHSDRACVSESGGESVSDSVGKSVCDSDYANTCSQINEANRQQMQAASQSSSDEAMRVSCVAGAS